MAGLQVSRVVVILVMALALLLAVAQTARADPFVFVSESAVFNPAMQEVSFRIEFNQAPDFNTVDAVGRQANSFQYFIVGDPSLPYPAHFDAIIRGEELHFTGNVLRIRDSLPPADPTQISGGWGPVRGVVPFTLVGNVFTFSAPLQLISDHSLDGQFTYTLESYEFGGLTRHATNRSVVVPEPSSLVLLCIGTLGLLARGRRRLR